MEINNSSPVSVNPAVITPGFGLGLEKLSTDVMLQACMIEEINRKIDGMKTKLVIKTALLGAYNKHIGKLEMIHDKKRGGGDTKIYKTFARTDFTYDEKSGEVREIKKGKLATKDPVFGAKYTPKAALTAEIERLKKTADGLKKEVSQLEGDLKELITRKKALLEEVANGVAKKEKAMKDMATKA